QPASKPQQVSISSQTAASVSDPSLRASRNVLLAIRLAIRSVSDPSLRASRRGSEEGKRV
ncbi:MAG: hypothetical protein ABSG67_06920, partial [Thermoguttaceae bacterium]